MRMYVIAALAVFGSLLFSVQSASALTVAPTVVEISADPGQTIEKAVRLKNETDQQKIVRPSTQNFVADPSGDGNPMYIGNKNANSLANWIVVDSTRVVLNPGESKDVKFTVKVPADATPGGHYAALFWGDVAPTKTPNANVSVSGQIAAPLVLLNVNGAGAIVGTGRLLSFATKDGKAKYERFPISFVAKIANEGNVHFSPQGTVEIMNMFGQVVARIPFNNVTEGGNVFPMRNRDFEVVWDHKEFALGGYTARLNFTYGNGGRSETMDVKFWVMPPGMTMAWVAIVVLVLAGLIIGFKAMSPAKPARNRK